MNQLNKWVLITSLVFCIVCLIGSIWMASVLRDSTSYVMTVIFVLAVIWLAVNVWRSWKQKD